MPVDGWREARSIVCEGLSLSMGTRRGKGGGCFRQHDEGGVSPNDGLPFSLEGGRRTVLRIWEPKRCEKMRSEVGVGGEKLPKPKQSTHWYKWLKPEEAAEVSEIDARVKTMRAEIDVLSLRRRRLCDRARARRREVG